MITSVMGCHCLPSPEPKLMAAEAASEAVPRTMKLLVVSPLPLSDHPLPTVGTLGFVSLCAIRPMKRSAAARVEDRRTVQTRPSALIVEEDDGFLLVFDEEGFACCAARPDLSRVSYEFSGLAARTSGL